MSRKEKKKERTCEGTCVLLEVRLTFMLRFCAGRKKDIEYENGGVEENSSVKMFFIDENSIVVKYNLLSDDSIYERRKITWEQGCWRAGIERHGK